MFTHKGKNIIRAMNMRCQFCHEKYINVMTERAIVKCK